MKKSLLLLLVLALAVTAYSLLLRTGGEGDNRSVEGLPWQIEVLPGGESRVFGITLGKDTLGDARRKLGDDMDLAIIVSRDDDRALEMFYKHYTAGLFSGKLVLGADVADETLRQMLERSSSASYMKSGARKFHPAEEDLATAWQAPVTTITFIPTVRLDEETALKRFGKPEETVRRDGAATHLLYPGKGLDLIIDSRGKSVLQYVAPRDFDRLRAPLLAEDGN